MLSRIVNRASSFRAADEWDISQQLAMTADERRLVAQELRRRFYGDRCPDVRQATNK